MPRTHVCLTKKYNLYIYICRGFVPWPLIILRRRKRKLIENYSKNTLITHLSQIVHWIQWIIRKPQIDIYKHPPNSGRRATIHTGNSFPADSSFYLKVPQSSFICSNKGQPKQLGLYQWWALCFPFAFSSSSFSNTYLWPTNSCQSCFSLHRTQKTIVPPMTFDKITWILFGLGISAIAPPNISGKGALYKSV